MAIIDCSTLSCLPVEMYLGLVGISIAFAIFGFIRQPQIPAMLMFGGIFILFIGVMFNGIILGVQPESSTTTGSTTDYVMVNHGFDMSGVPQMLVGLIGAVMMLTSGIMVSKT